MARVVEEEDGIRVEFPRLRGFLIHHPLYGVEANWKKRKQMVRYACLTDSLEAEEVLSDPELMMEVLYGFGRSVGSVRKWLDALWGPGGVMMIPRDEYMDIEGFAQWWEARKKR